MGWWKRPVNGIHCKEVHLGQQQPLALYVGITDTEDFSASSFQGTCMLCKMDCQILLSHKMCRAEEATLTLQSTLRREKARDVTLSQVFFAKWIPLPLGPFLILSPITGGGRRIPSERFWETPHEESQQNQGIPINAPKLNTWTFFMNVLSLQQTREPVSQSPDQGAWRFLLVRLSGKNHQDMIWINARRMPQKGIKTLSNRCLDVVGAKPL